MFHQITLIVFLSLYLALTPIVCWQIKHYLEKSSNYERIIMHMFLCASIVLQLPYFYYRSNTKWNLDSFDQSGDMETFYYTFSMHTIACSLVNISLTSTTCQWNRLAFKPISSLSSSFSLSSTSSVSTSTSTSSPSVSSTPSSVSASSSVSLCKWQRLESSSTKMDRIVHDPPTFCTYWTYYVIPVLHLMTVLMMVFVLLSSIPHNLRGYEKFILESMVYKIFLGMDLLCTFHIAICVLCGGIRLYLRLRKTALKAHQLSRSSHSIITALCTLVGSLNVHLGFTILILSSSKIHITSEVSNGRVIGKIVPYGVIIFCMVYLSRRSNSTKSNTQHHQASEHTKVNLPPYLYKNTSSYPPPYLDKNTSAHPQHPFSNHQHPFAHHQHPFALELALALPSAIPLELKDEFL